MFLVTGCKKLLLHSIAIVIISTALWSRFYQSIAECYRGRIVVLGGSLLFDSFKLKGLMNRWFKAKNTKYGIKKYALVKICSFEKI